MEIIIVIMVLAGVIAGGATGIALSKWPARNTARSTVKGAVFGMGALVVFVMFIALVAFFAIDWPNGDGTGPVQRS